ncbi:hypothetical protein [Geothrix limicola]|uniref:hypothetical protein n=1 Tax=Geothrix limicola TaxID=2927978 RepID=UPI002553B5AB|nr:hypothetical protein [Geothrix limicola]
MFTSTALLTELLVVGSLAWLWILPIICGSYSLRVTQIFDFLGKAPLSHHLLIVFGTYVIGAFVESLSFSLEKLVVGKTSGPRKWYARHIATMAPGDWRAAQDRIWSSETAFREFSQTNLRTSISRAAFLNANIAIIVLIILVISSKWDSTLKPFLWISIFISLCSPIAWWFSQIEHTARVRIAGAIKKDQAPNNPTA